MTSVAFKNYRRVIFWLLIATAPVLSYKFGADSVHSGSHDPYDAITNDCERAVYENKPDVVFKLSNQYEKTELKEFLKRKEDPSLRVWDDYRGYPYYRALAYEASGDYKGAFEAFADGCDELVTNAHNGNVYDIGNEYDAAPKKKTPGITPWRPAGNSSFPSGPWKFPTSARCPSPTLWTR